MTGGWPSMRTPWARCAGAALRSFGNSAFGNKGLPFHERTEEAAQRRLLGGIQGEGLAGLGDHLLQRGALHLLQQVHQERRVHEGEARVGRAPLVVEENTAEGLLAEAEARSAAIGLVPVHGLRL